MFRTRVDYFGDYSIISIQTSLAIDIALSLHTIQHHWIVPCRTPLFEECPQHHGHKEDPGVTLGTCGAIGERA